MPLCVSIGCVACVWASAGLLCSLCWNRVEVVRGTCVVARVVCVCLCVVRVFTHLACYLPACHSSRRVVENLVYQLMLIGFVSCVMHRGILSMSVVIVRARQYVGQGCTAFDYIFIHIQSIGGNSIRCMRLCFAVNPWDSEPLVPIPPIINLL